jgi:hypothetical protein
MDTFQGLECQKSIKVGDENRFTPKTESDILMPGEI